MWAYSSRAPDPLPSPPTWREMWLETERRQRRSCPAALAAHQSRDAYWKARSVIEFYYSAIKAKVLASAVGAIPTKNAVAPVGRSPARCQKGSSALGCINNPHFASRPRIGFLQESPFAGGIVGSRTSTPALKTTPDYPRLSDGRHAPPRHGHTSAPGRWISRSHGRRLRTLPG